MENIAARNVRPLWERLFNSEKPILIYGTGNGADKIIDILESLYIKISGVFANDAFVRGQMFRGHKVTTYAQAVRRFGSMVCLMAFGTHRRDVMDTALQIAGEQEFYIPDVPVCGSDIFDSAFLSKNTGAINCAYHLLGDDLSRNLFCSMLDFKLGGKRDDLFAYTSTTSDLYALLAPGGNDTYVDAGAYNGDSVLEFIQHAGGYKEVLAIEPDEKNFKKLQRNLTGMHHVRLVHGAILDQCQPVMFDSAAGRNSRMGGEGAKVQGYSIDCLLDGKKADIIKYDVEGAEIKALAGTCQTIEAHRPRLLVSAYHRSGDLFEIPLLVQSIRKDYNILLRRLPCMPAWDLYYCFV